LTGVRRGLFLLAGFVAGFVPGIVSGTYVISAHRIMMCYGFIALGAAAAVNVVPWRRVRVPLAALVLVGTGIWSIPFYFSDRFWPTRWPGDRESSALTDAIAEAPPAHLIVMHHIGFYGYLTGVDDAAPLMMDNLIPPANQAVTYAFTWQASLLRPQYERLFPKRVLPTGRDSFLVAFEAADWSWVGQHGWALEARCGDLTRFFRAPFLYNTNQIPNDFRCPTPVTYVWRAHWSGPATDMDLAYGGSVTVTIGERSVTKEGYEDHLIFSLPADTDVTISLTIPPGAVPTAVLLETSKAGPRAGPSSS